jgi:putative SOS response-associated peptidase YedK
MLAPKPLPRNPSFRSAFKQRRCLIPASGFYEWRKDGKRKQPFFICPRDGVLFSFAGLWERWHDPAGEEIESCAILTTTANELMQEIHERMPVILDPSAEEQSLDLRSTPDVLGALLVPFVADQMEAFLVSPWVSDPKHEGPRCLERVDVS